MTEAVSAYYGVYNLTDAISVPIKENLLRIEVFYDRIAKTEVVETAAMSDFQFISDLGEFRAQSDG